MCVFVSSVVHKHLAPDHPQSACNKRLVGGSVADAVISLTALAVGILGLVGILPGLPPAASYTLIGVSALITLEWIVLASATGGEMVEFVAEAFRDVCGGSEGSP